MQLEMVLDAFAYAELLRWRCAELFVHMLSSLCCRPRNYKLPSPRAPCRRLPATAEASVVSTLHLHHRGAPGLLQVLEEDLPGIPNSAGFDVSSYPSLVALWELQQALVAAVWWKRFWSQQEASPNPEADL